MTRQLAIGFVLVVLGLTGSCLGAESQKAVVIHAGLLFDGKSDRLLSQQVIVIQGDRIAEVGPAGSVKMPPGEEIDLGTGTVLPGLIEGHNHMFKIGDYPGTGAEAAVPLVIPPSRALPRREICRAAGLPMWTFALRSTQASSRGRGWSSRRKVCGDRPPGLVTSTSWTRHGKDANKCGYNSRTELILSRFTSITFSRPHTGARRSPWRNNRRSLMKRTDKG